MSSKKILNFNEYNKLNEMTEFNVQRMNSDSVQPSTHVNDPNASLGAFDKHQDIIRNAFARLNTISQNLSNTNAFKNIKRILALDDQDITSLKILRISKYNNINYNVYINFMIDGLLYWGVVENILDRNPMVSSEVFKDTSLHQSKEWVIKTKGSIVKIIRNWLEPERGTYKSLKGDILCYSIETGKQLSIDIDTEVEVIGSDEKKIVISHKGDVYHLKGDNYVYFNWWFEFID